MEMSTVIGYICVFGTGLLGAFLFQSFVEDLSFPSKFKCENEVILLFSDFLFQAKLVLLIL